MSEEQEEVSNEQQQEEEEGEQSEQEEGEQEEDEQENQEQDEQDGNEDEEQQEGDGQQDQVQEEPQQKPTSDYKLPEFPRRTHENPFDNILYELNSLQHSVDHLIDSFPSKKGTRFGNYLPTSSIHRDPTAGNRSRLDQLASQVSSMQLRSPPVVTLKDGDTQVDMQPQIIIKATAVHEQKQRPFEGNRKYAINTESDRFLSKLQEDNRKYRRWDRTDPQGTAAAQLGRTRQRFQRRDYQQGVFNLQQRNKQIDEAMRMLRQ